MRTSPTLSIVVVDDHVVARKAIAETLRAELGCHVSLSSSESEEAIRMVRAAQPAAVLLDARVKNGDAVSLINALREKASSARIVVTGVTPHQPHIAELIAAGARGFVMNDAPPDEYTITVRTVVEGGHSLPRRLTGWLFDQIARAQMRSTKADGAAAGNLSVRERQVLALIGEGLSNKEIAARLVVSVHTVKSHVRNLLEKLRLPSRREVVAFAETLGEPHD